MDPDPPPSFSRLHCGYYRSISEECIKDPNKLLQYYDVDSCVDVQDLGTKCCIAPRILAELLCEYVPEEQRPIISVVDIEANNGSVGYEMTKRGFETIDAVDRSKVNLNKIQQSGVYRRTMQIVFKNDESCDSCLLPDDEYDIVTCAHGFIPGNLPSSALYNLIRICKPGGLIVVLVWMKWLSESGEIPWLLPVLDELDRRKPCCWRLLKRKIFLDPLSSQEFLVFVYRKTPHKSKPTLQIQELSLNDGSQNLAS